MHSASRSLQLAVLALLTLISDVSAACYYDNLTGRTTCDGLSYGARLAIAAALSIVCAMVVTAISYFVRRRMAANNGPPPASAGYYGPPSQPPPGFVPQYPTGPYAQPVYSAAPVYAPPQGNPYAYQPYGAPPPGYVQTKPEAGNGSAPTHNYAPPTEPPPTALRPQ